MVAHPNSEILKQKSWVRIHHLPGVAGSFLNIVKIVKKQHQKIHGPALAYATKYCTYCTVD